MKNNDSKKEICLCGRNLREFLERFCFVWFGVGAKLLFSNCKLRSFVRIDQIFGNLYLQESLAEPKTKTEITSEKYYLLA